MNLERLTMSDGDDVELININEELIKAHVKEAMSGIDMCKCKLCQLNACAIALNAIKPKYVTSKKGEMLAKIGLMKMEVQTEITIKVSKAIKIVKECPLH
jgi:competence protein ComFB